MSVNRAKCDVLGTDLRFRHISLNINIIDEFLSSFYSNAFLLFAIPAPSEFFSYREALLKKYFLSFVKTDDSLCRSTTIGSLM